MLGKHVNPVYHFVNFVSVGDKLFSPYFIWLLYCLAGIALQVVNAIKQTAQLNSTQLTSSLFRQGRAEPAKYVFRGNSTPPARGAGWTAQICLGEPTGQWGASWKECVTIWTCIQQSIGARKRRLRYSLTQPVCDSLKIPFWNRCKRYVHRFVQCSVSLLWCTRSSRLYTYTYITTLVRRLSKHDQSAMKNIIQ